MKVGQGRFVAYAVPGFHYSIAVITSPQQPTGLVGERTWKERSWTTHETEAAAWAATEQHRKQFGGEA